MIAEDTHPSDNGRESQPRPGTTPDALRNPAVDSPAGATALRAAGQASAGLEGGVEHAAAALKPRMRGWLHTGMIPLSLAGGIVLIALSRSAAAVAACSVFAVSALLCSGQVGSTTAGRGAREVRRFCGDWTTRTSS